ncbi:MAG: FAD:protein FMN transferase [Magnetospiraceae bacterium]
MRFPAILLLCVTLLVGACRPNDAPYRETFYVFGTLVEFVVWDSDADTARTAVRDAAHLLQRYHDAWHAWRPGQVATVNAAFARGETARIDPELARLIAVSQSLNTASGGLFDPGIGALIAAWGFHDDTPPEGRAPPLGAIEDYLRTRPTIAQVTVDGDQIRSANPAVRLDFGAIAKGYALDRAMEILARHGLKNGLINAGGDLNVAGTAPGRPWRVAIRNPVGWGAVAWIEARNGEAIYTSGNYERFLEYEGVRFAHILDPRTGMPIHHIVSATVISDNGALADAAATALSVAGADWPAVARQLGVTQALIIGEDGAIEATPAMAKRLRGLSAAQHLTLKNPARSAS